MKKQGGGGESEAPGDRIICPLAPWFFRRMGMLTLLAAGLAFYFFYDGAIGYPKKNFNADLFEAFMAGRSAESWDVDRGGENLYTEEQIGELKKANQSGSDGATWAVFAAKRFLPEKAPKRYTGAEIRQQFQFAILLGMIAVGVVISLFLQRKKSFRCDRETIITPRRREIPFSAVSRLDLRKWDRGIARLTVRDGSEGRESAIKMDGYKYAGTEQILRRLCRSNENIEVLGDRRWIFADDDSQGAE